MQAVYFNPALNFLLLFLKYGKFYSGSPFVGLCGLSFMHFVLMHGVVVGLSVRLHIKISASREHYAAVILKERRVLSDSALYTLTGPGSQTIL